MTTAHGFGDDEASRFLRRRPPAEALRWVEANLEATVTRVRALKGGSSSAIHAVTAQPNNVNAAADADAGTITVVLRRYVRPDVDEPDIVEREARTLALLQTSGAATPELLAADPAGTHADMPALLMTRLPGRVVWEPDDDVAWLRRMAEALPAIHDTPAPTGPDGVQPFRPYGPASWSPPSWLRDPRRWERAVELFHAPPLDEDRVLIHRDFHPGNVLWRRGRVSGVIDWQDASIGPRSVDVFWCRANLIRHHDLAMADRFRDTWETVTGATYHPWAESVMLLDCIGFEHERTERERNDLETALARALADLGA